jgi:hypothetical protein
MAHLNTCRIRKELTGNIWVEYSEPDLACTDESHNEYTQEQQ